MPGTRGAAGGARRLGTCRKSTQATPPTPDAGVIRTGRVIGSVLVAVTTALVACLSAGAADARRAQAVSPVRVAAFFYPWWGTPASDSRWLHWGQRGMRPP